MPPLKKPAGAVKEFNFGDAASYSKGGAFAEGDYCWTELNVEMYQYRKKDGTDAGTPKLCVVIHMVPLGGGEEIIQPYSLGSKAHESWAPNPVTGKGLVEVPGGPGTGINSSTNWSLLGDSLRDSGLPEGILVNDLSVLEGIHVHMINIPEPEGRKGFQSQTGEAVPEQRGPKTIAVVSEIKDDGKPWEGTGGMPEAEAPKPPVKGVAKPAGKPAAKVAAAVTKAPEPVAEEGEGDVQSAAISGVSKVLEAKPNGVPKLVLRTSTFKEVNAEHGQEMANQVINTYFGSDDALNGLLGEVGFVLANGQVKPAA